MFTLMQIEDMLFQRLQLLFSQSYLALLEVILS